MSLAPKNPRRTTREDIQKLLDKHITEVMETGSTAITTEHVIVSLSYDPEKKETS